MTQAIEAVEPACRCRAARLSVPPDRPARVLVVSASPAGERASPTHSLAESVDGALHRRSVDCERLDLALCEATDARRLCAQAQAVVLVGAAPGADVAELLERIAGHGALAGRAYGLLLHGHARAVGAARRAMSDRLDQAGLIDAGAQARLDRFAGLDAPCPADAPWSAEPLDDDLRHVASAVAKAALEIRAGRLTAPDLLLAKPRCERR